MRLAVLCLLLSSCGPVLVGEEKRAQDASSTSEAGPTSGGGAVAARVDASTTYDAGPVPEVTVGIRPLDCGRCFELHAVGSAGRAPYDFEWGDGTLGAQRVVCVKNAELSVSVVARDATALRSAPQTIHLRRAADADCPQQAMPAEPPPRPKLCIQNGSFEGTPAANFGQGQTFDAVPWSVCTNLAETNTPDIGNGTVAQTLGPVPEPTEGLTFLALGEGEQVSQEFCSPFPDDAPVAVEFDLTRLNIGAGIVPETEQVYLEVWGGLGVDCSRRELLWTSRALQVGWVRYCAALEPHGYITQLTLRANADMTLPTPAYLAIDNLKAVDACP